MKVSLGEGVQLSCLRRRLELEGNEIVPLSEAEFLVTNKPVDTIVPSLKSGEKFNSAAVQTLGFPSCQRESDFYLSRYWNQYSGWHSQTFLGIPLIGLMNGGLSVPVLVGSAGTYVEGEKVEALFRRPELDALLKELKHSGFVSLWLNSEEGLVSSIETGLPAWGLYNILEGIPRRIEDFLVEPENTRLKESWTVSLLVSRFPYPGVLSTKENASIIGLTESVEKHFWLGDHSRFKNSVYSSSTVVGVSTAWGRTLRDAAERATGTARHLEIPQVQYRTDAGIAAGFVYGKVKELGLF